MSTEQFFVNTLLVVLIIFAVIFIINLVFSVLEYKHSKYTNNELLRMARETIKEAQNNTPVSHTEENNDEIDYEGMTYIDLKKIAKAKNIKGYYRLHKDELIKIIKNTK